METDLADKPKGKILLWGDISGMMTQFRSALTECGCSVVHVDGGNIKNGNKEAVFNRRLFKNKFLEALMKRLYAGFVDRWIFNQLKGEGFDLILVAHLELISPSSMFYKYCYPAATIDRRLVRRIMPKHGVFVILPSPSQYFYEKMHMMPVNQHMLSGPDVRYYNQVETMDRMVDFIDGLIPIMIDYRIPMKNTIWDKKGKLKETVLIPFRIPDERVLNKIESKKIRILHVVTRSKHKGSCFIIEALDALKNDPRFEIIILNKKLPLPEFEKELQMATYYIDQCCSMSYGVASLVALAKGKVVFAPCTKEFMTDAKIKWTPVVHIEPNVNQILSAIIKYEYKGFESVLNSNIKYLREYHDPIKIGENLLNVCSINSNL